MLTKNWAFMCGSSKQGKAARAEVGSKCVVARYLKKVSSLTVLAISLECTVTKWTQH